MKNIDRIATKLNSMTEEERADFIMSELSLEEVYALYDEYGYATEIGNGTVKASYAEVEDERF